MRGNCYRQMTWSEQEGIEIFERWRVDMERRGLKINISKTKGIITGRQPGRRARVEDGRAAHVGGASGSIQCSARSTRDRIIRGV